MVPASLDDNKEDQRVLQNSMNEIVTTITVGDDEANDDEKLAGKYSNTVRKNAFCSRNVCLAKIQQDTARRHGRSLDRAPYSNDSRTTREHYGSCNETRQQRVRRRV